MHQATAIFYDLESGSDDTFLFVAFYILVHRHVFLRSYRYGLLRLAITKVVGVEPVFICKFTNAENRNFKSSILCVLEEKAQTVIGELRISAYRFSRRLMLSLFSYVPKNPTHTPPNVCEQSTFGPAKCEVWGLTVLIDGSLLELVVCTSS